jgi:hypothetical protein
MNTSEMTQVSVIVQLFRDNCVTRSLLQIETGGRYQVSSGQKVGQLLADVEIRFCQCVHEVFGCV